MAETMASGVHETRESTDALDAQGYVLALASTGKVAKCAAGGKAYGVNMTDTKNKVSGTAEANKVVAVVQKGSKAQVQYNLSSTDEDIVLGDYVSMKAANAAGCVKDHEGTVLSSTPTKAEVDAFNDEQAMIVGIAMEGVAAPGAGSITGTLEVRLTCPTFGRQE